MPTGGAASGRVCACSLRSRLVFLSFGFITKGSGLLLNTKYVVAPNGWGLAEFIVAIIYCHTNSLGYTTRKDRVATKEIFFVDSFFT